MLPAVQERSNFSKNEGRLVTWQACSERGRLRGDIRLLQKHQDKKDDIEDGNDDLGTVSNSVPSTLREQLHSVGNVRAAVTFGPLIVEIGAHR